MNNRIKNTVFALTAASFLASFSAYAGNTYRLHFHNYLNSLVSGLFNRDSIKIQCYQTLQRI